VSGYYDRDGHEMDMWAWAAQMRHPEYKRVAQVTVTDLANPEVAYDVSTVWLGLDHNFGDGPPLIFETMIFGDGSLDLTCRRYITEEQALAGHKEMVDIVRSVMTDPLVSDVTGRSTMLETEAPQDRDS
jgi:hypothetical protein